MIKSRITAKGKGNEIVIEPHTVLRNCKIIITGDNNKLIIHSNVKMINCNIYLTESQNTVEIGSGTKFAGAADIVAGECSKVTIGEECLFSKEITIRSYDSHPIYDMEGDRVNRSKNVNIGNRVWVTQDVKILKGSYIDDGCVLATGTIITKNFSGIKESIIAGAPAKVIKDNIRWTSERT